MSLPILGFSWLFFRLGSLGCSLGWVLSASPPHRWVDVPARRSDAKVGNGFMYVHQTKITLTYLLC